MFQRLLSRLDVNNDDDIGNATIEEDIFSPGRKERRRKNVQEGVLLQGLPSPTEMKSSSPSSPSSEISDPETNENSAENPNGDQNYESRVTKVLTFIFGGGKAPETQPNNDQESNIEENEESSANDINIPSINTELSASPTSTTSPSPKSRASMSVSTSPPSSASSSTNSNGSPGRSSANSSRTSSPSSKTNRLTNGSSDDNHENMEEEEQKLEWEEERAFLESKVDRLENFQRQTMKKLLELQKRSEILQEKLREKHFESIRWKRKKMKGDEEIKDLKKRIEVLEKNSKEDPREEENEEKESSQPENEESENAEHTNESKNSKSENSSIHKKENGEST